MFAVCQVGYLAVLTVFVLIQDGLALKCYTCNNNKNTDCGPTFTMTGAAEKAALLECKGAYAACRKFVIDDTPKRTVIVTRDCYTMNASVTMDMLCTDIVLTGKSCYCNTDGCNSQTANVASLAIVFTSLIMFFVYAQFY